MRPPVARLPITVPARGVALSAALLADLAVTSCALAVVLVQRASAARIASSVAATLLCALCVNGAALLLLRARRRTRQEAAAVAAAREGERGRAEGERHAAVGRIAAAVGHDLASPVASASANLRFVEAELALASPGTEVVEAVREARQALERVRYVVSDLRALTPLGAGEVAEVDLAPAVGQGLRLAAARLGAGAELDARLPPELPQVRASPPHLAHLVSVLVSAAAMGGGRAEPAGGSPVALEARVDGEAVQLAVTGSHAAESAGVALCGELARRWGGRVEAGWAPDGRARIAITLRRAAPAAVATRGTFR
jgi:signal transduction histidine kinase